MQQPGWGGPLPPPPKQHNTTKWLLAGVDVLLVIAITVGVTVLVTRSGLDRSGPTTSTSASGPPIASADDDGPIEIITSEPTCQAWIPASNAKSKVQENGWGNRDPEIPAVDWSIEQRAQYDAVAESLRSSADEAVDFARQTPHRVVRELYEQFIAFSRAYADSVSHYTGRDNFLAQAWIAAGNAVDAICNSITYGAAGAQSASVASIDAPADAVPPGDPAEADRVLTESTESCTKFREIHERLIADTTEWVSFDPNVPAADWSTSPRSVAGSTASAMLKFADNVQEVGRGGSNPVFEDLTSFSAIYFRAYAASLTSYVAADSYLLLAASRGANILSAACDAASG